LVTASTNLVVAVPGTPPQASADHVRDLYATMSTARREAIDAEEALYRATYQANQDGWSDRALGAAIGVPYRTVQGWREKGEQLAEG
jgi:hypothetical protein